MCHVLHQDTMQCDEHKRHIANCAKSFQSECDELRQKLDDLVEEGFAKYDEPMNRLIVERDLYRRALEEVEATMASTNLVSRVWSIARKALGES